MSLHETVPNEGETWNANYKIYGYAITISSPGVKFIKVI